MVYYKISEIDKVEKEKQLDFEFKSAEQAEVFITKVRELVVKDYIPESNETIDSKFRIYKMPGKELIKEL
jgi:hypothetical protein